MYVKITIEGIIPDERYEEIKKWEHHIEYTGIPDNYPELEDIGVKVEEQPCDMQYEVYLILDDDGSTRRLICFETLDEAEDYCDIHDWEYYDNEEGCLRRMEYRRIISTE